MQNSEKKRLLKISLMGLAFWFILIPLGLSIAIAFSKLSIIELMMTMTPKTQMGGINIVAYGIDETKDTRRADTIIVFHVDPQKKRLGVVSIPRDTRMLIKGHGMSKINHAFAFGGPELLKETLSNFLSIPIQHHFQINLAGIVQLIDEIGGVTLEVEKDLIYQDQAANFEINLKKGRQTMNGQEVVQFLRFRQDNEGDIGRIRRQQVFLRALADRVIYSGRFFELPGLISALNKAIVTDMNSKQLVGLAVEFGEAFKTGDIETATVPGAVTLIKGVSYWRPDFPLMDKMVSKVLFGFEKGQLLAGSRVKTVDTGASEESRRRVNINEVTRISDQTELAKRDLESMPKALTVEILNGFGTPGAAMRAARYLKGKGVKVARFGNAGSFSYDETTIVDWKGNIQDVLVFAKSMAIDPSKIIVYDKPEKTLDVTLVLGADWERLVKQVEPELSQAR